jgi:Flp pilus assembly protein CpaB
VPAGALLGATRVVGRLLAAPVRRGEPLTDVRLLEPSLLAAMPRAGLVAVPVRVADGGAAAVLASPGDVVDVRAAPHPGAGVSATDGPVAAGLTVLAVPAAATSGADGAGLVIVAATRAQARALAEATVGTRLSLVLRHP